MNMQQSLSKDALKRDFIKIPTWPHTTLNEELYLEVNTARFLMVEGHTLSSDSNRHRIICEVFYSDRLGLTKRIDTELDKETGGLVSETVEELHSFIQHYLYKINLNRYKNLINSLDQELTEFKPIVTIDEINQLTESRK